MQNARTRVCRSLGLSQKPGVDLARWCSELDDYRRLAAGLADNPHVRIEQRTENGKLRDHLVLTGLDRLTEPASLKTCVKRSTPAAPPSTSPNSSSKSTPDRVPEPFRFQFAFGRWPLIPAPASMNPSSAAETKRSDAAPRARRDGSEAIRAVAVGAALTRPPGDE
ncbi:hypothetical protein AB0I68_35015 [Streptomyces sp. NPDC050448]|uniref:hypothetical protein n=1 Tax=Streptomyces sp. NPDC050448 TaxID=3155404 RepID=UPI00342CB2A6